ncbi:MAG: glycosyltransferase family 2 protein [Flavobacteriales bacterium]
MKLTVIIVNYNVRAYLEQCLRTVRAAMEGVDGEVYVVDNQSTDGSVQLVRQEFPEVKLIANSVNVGFSRANNQAILESTGEYVLLLNPDTVVGEDVFRKVLTYLDAHDRVGGLGVKMIDGTGRFLPESKRGLPTPEVAFYKIIGLTRLFPRSKVFGRYQLGHLPENETNPIEILSGACMFLRRRTLDEVGLLDESFFMYGEDIDLSYRITLGGFENHYFPEARIIHYKGESTKKSSVNYVFVFYNAMAIFARKYFTGRGGNLFSFLINGAIYLSAAAAIVARFLRRALLPLLDLALLVGTGLVLAGDAWAPVRSLTWGGVMLASFGLMGGYDQPIHLRNAVKGGLLFFLVRTAWSVTPHAVGIHGTGMLVPPLLETGIMLAVAFLTRGLLHLLRVKGYGLRDRGKRRVLAVGSEEQARKALALLWQTHYGLGRQTIVGPEDVSLDASNLRARARRERIDELVFCAADLSAARIIQWMERLKRSRAQIKIAQPGGTIIGPNSAESLGDLLVLERHGIHSAAARRMKRTTDLAVAVLLLISAPLTIWLVKDRAGLIRNAVGVLLGRYTWVGYAGNPVQRRLPVLAPAVLGNLAAWPATSTRVSADRMDLLYAKDYRPSFDVRCVVRSFRSLGDPARGRA